MNRAKRIKALKAMDYIARCCKSYNVISDWLTVGIADGDANDDRELVYYTRDDVFAEIMANFITIMCEAKLDSGICCDGVSSEDE